MTNKRILAATLMAACCFCLSACSSTGGDIGGLLPAPKFLKGDIENGVYTAKDKRFTVAVPWAQGSNDYTYMHVKEQYSSLEDYVSFGPGAIDQSIYRVDIVMRATPGSMIPSFDEAAPKAFAAMEAKTQDAYGAPLAVTASDKTEVNGHPALHWQLKQDVPTGKLANVPVTLMHDVYAIDYGFAVAVVWVQKEPNDLKDPYAPTAAAFAASLKPEAEPGNGAAQVAADGTFRFPKQAVTVVAPAVLCGSAATTVLVSDTSVDFTGSDQLWQLAGDYAVQVFPKTKQITDEQGFMALSKKYMEGYVPGDRKNLGASPHVTTTKEMEVGGMPAFQALGVEEGKDFVYATAIDGKSRVIVVSVLAPLRAGEDPAATPAAACYAKFLTSLKVTD